MNVTRCDVPHPFPLPPPSPTATTVTCGRHRRRQAPRWTPTFGPIRGELIDSAGAQRCCSRTRHLTPNNPAQQHPTTPTNTPRQHPTTTPNKPHEHATSPANDAHQATTSPPNDAQHCRPTTMTLPMSSTTTTTSLPKGNSRRWGWWGRTDKGREYGRGGLGWQRQLGHHRSPDFLSTPGGMEGRGQQRTPSLPPRVDKGVGWHIHASYFLPPPVPAASSMGAGVNPTCRPPFDFVYPPHWGFFFSCVVNNDGGSVCITCCPIFIFYPWSSFPPPFWGDSFFFLRLYHQRGWCMTRPPLSLCFPRFIGVFFSAAVLLTRGRRTTHLPFPPLSFTPHKLGEIFFYHC